MLEQEMAAKEVSRRHTWMMLEKWKMVVYMYKRGALHKDNYLFIFAIVTSIQWVSFPTLYFRCHPIIVGVDGSIRYFQVNHVGTYGLVLRGQ